MIVHARPLNKLCEHDGKKLPPDYKSDCYHDVDETEYACKEKYRIMVRFLIFKKFIFISKKLSIVVNTTR